MADRFNELQMLQLVETYRDYPCLWNVTSDLYKNRNARDSAYREIWEKLNIPGLSIKDIPKKIKNMRTSYYQELKRIEKSIRSGAGQDSVYKPKVPWFDTADGFLKLVRNNHESLSNFVSEEATNEEIYLEEPTDTKNFHLEHESESAESSSTVNEFKWIPETPLEPNYPVHYKKLKTPPETPHMSKSISKETASKRKDELDEYDYFAGMIAAKIRKIENMDDREELMNTIQNLTFQCYMKGKRRNLPSDQPK